MKESIYDFKVKDIDGNEISMATFKEKVIFALLDQQHLLYLLLGIALMRQLNLHYVVLPTLYVMN